MKNKGGRPTVMTPETIAKLVQAFSIDATVEEACSYADISRDAFYDYLKRNPKFSDRIADLRQKPVLKARQTIVSNLDNPQYAQWYLSRKKKLEFSERQETDITTGGDKLTTYNDDQLERIAARILNGKRTSEESPN